MLSDIYYRKKLGIPYLSSVLLMSCIIVTAAIRIIPELAQVLGGYKPFNYPWQYFTMIFNHGSYNLPTILHLLCNGIVILFFGVFSERILGTKKFALFTVISAIVFYLETHFMFNDWESMNGISGIIWGYTVFVFYIVFVLYKTQKKKIFNDYLFYISIFFLFLFWIAVSVGDYVMSGGVSYGLIAHIISVLVGTVFVLLWRNNIRGRLIDISKNKIKEQNTSKHKKIIISFFSVPIFIVMVIILSLSGVLFSHRLPLESIIPSSGGIEELNLSRQQIRVSFKSPMNKEIINSGLHTSSEGVHSLKLKMDINWLNNRTLLITFNREIFDDETIKVSLSGFSTIEGRAFNEEVLLEFGK